MAINKRIIRSNDGGAAVATSFNTVLYTGNGTNLPITGVGFQPDFVWLKRRDAGYPYTHKLIDSVRGATIRMSSNETGPDITEINGLKSFDSDGFTLGGDGGYNINGAANVAWCWKAGGAAVTNTDGTITSQVSANTEAGFSIVTFTGVNLSSNSIGHGLGVTPSLVIMKGRNVATEWRVYSDQLNNDQFLKLNETAAATAIGINKTWTSTTISQQWAPASYDWVAYCFAEVAGFSKFGSYTGNGSTSGPTIDCGFEPAFVMIKSTGTRSWRMIDNKRSPTNPATKDLRADSANAENDWASNGWGNILNFNSTNFQIVGTDTQINNSGETYIYMAFANQF